MSQYNILFNVNNQNIKYTQDPSSYIWKDNPLKDFPIIDSNIAGLNKKNIMMIPKNKSVYPLNYESFNDILVNVSKVTPGKLREVITPP